MISEMEIGAESERILNDQIQLVGMLVAKMHHG
jgi:hypothetical protein